MDSQAELKHEPLKWLNDFPSCSVPNLYPSQPSPIVLLSLGLYYIRLSFVFCVFLVQRNLPRYSVCAVKLQSIKNLTTLVRSFQCRCGRTISLYVTPNLYLTQACMCHASHINFNCIILALHSWTSYNYDSICVVL